MRRRTALKALTSASVGLSVAGCLGGERTPGDTTETTTGDCPPKNQQTPTCGDDWERVNAYTSGEVESGTAGGFELTAEPTTLALGDCVTFRLTNRSNEAQVTGIEEKYDIHRETPDGWRSVLFTKSRAYNDLGMSHKRGEGFVWQRRLSQGGLSVDGEGKHLRACEALSHGDYRFVYWGGAGEFEALGVEFEVTG